jgi:3-oxoacyl-[acyl-carrier-protein] synthase III
MRVNVENIEYYLPDKIQDNSDLEEENPDWNMGEVVKATGVFKRHVTADNQTSVDMAVSAAEKIFVNGVGRQEIDFIVLVTQSPDYLLPTSACLIQDRLKVKKECMAFDINLGCSGYLYGLSVCAGLLETGVAKKGLLICSETYTKFIDKRNRSCRSLFGDGAAATLLSACSSDKLGPFTFGTDGSCSEDLILRGSGARVNNDPECTDKLFMDGAKVFMFTMDVVPKSVEDILKKTGLDIQDIDLFVFHQASKLVLDNITRRLDLPEEKVFRNYQYIGNTVSASIPIALKDAENAKLLKRGDKVLLTGFGVGCSWGSCLLEW